MVWHQFVKAVHSQLKFRFSLLRFLSVVLCQNLTTLNRFAQWLYQPLPYIVFYLVFFIVVHLVALCLLVIEKSF